MDSLVGVLVVISSTDLFHNLCVLGLAATCKVLVWFELGSFKRRFGSYVHYCFVSFRCVDIFGPIHFWQLFKSLNFLRCPKCSLFFLSFSRSRPTFEDLSRTKPFCFTQLSVQFKMPCIYVIDITCQKCEVVCICEKKNVLTDGKQQHAQERHPRNSENVSCRMLLGNPYRMQLTCRWGLLRVRWIF